ncbi:hypothetical protein KUTeg_007743 [Tegillarca granosa]|uniref:Uncharacterized protein n=1 Tax=Tegillarca granosa TaxID=220873 RepID=A0ABQ9FE39_TEGGR|nr:hypothetical protein KUTeg_007743 [Tegillarca granosa]
MTLFTLLIFFEFLELILCRDLTLEYGHMKPFGSGRPNIEVEEFQNFPSPKIFFENNVLPMKPLIMKGAAKMSPAYDLWTDDYFLGLAIPDDNMVLVETKKKENRSQPTLDMNFQNFVKIYNKTDQYMVNPVPDFLRKDIIFPCPLQCPALTEKLLVENVS